MNFERNQTFLDFFYDLEDPRIERRKLYPVSELLLLTLLGVICGSEGWNDLEDFGLAKIDFLRTYLPFKNGIPSDDTLRRFFRRIDPKEFKTRFAAWIKSLDLPENKIIAIDGKVSRHSFDGENKPLHVVSAFASEYNMVLAQEKVDDKSNEIKAYPELLKWLDLKGSILTMDAMGCQRDVADLIVSKEANYVLALKGNQGTLNDDIRDFFKDKDYISKINSTYYETVDGDHGRIETRSYHAVEMPIFLKKEHNWPYLKSIMEVTSKRESKGIVQSEKRYYISSLEANAEIIGKAIRKHWAIENSLHWILDVSFNDDYSRIRHGNAPENIMVIKHVALNLLQKSKRKRESIKRLRKVAGWDDSRLDEIISLVKKI